jgi:hypothetical protein
MELKLNNLLNHNPWLIPTIHQKIEVWKIQPFTQKNSHGTTLAIDEIYEVWKTQSLNRDIIALMKEELINGKVGH